MITFIYNLDGELVTDLVNTAILNPDIIKVKNRLLDGTYHVQNIGSVTTVIDVICYVDKIGKDKIDNHYTTDTPIKLVKEDRFYKGLISDKGDWKVFSKSLFEISFKITAYEEGSI